MTEEKVRLGGMALANGVLVHGPTSWACAVRTDSGELKVVARRKRFSGAKIESPLLRGPARLADALAIVPQIRRALPATMVAAGVAARAIRESERLSPVVQELVGGAISLAPALIALRGGELAAYHGAEHISIGTYEHGERAEREHERCGSHLLGPLLATTAIGNTLASRAPVHMRKAARMGAQLAAVAASTEIFGWMVRNPEKRLARALAKPGHELQHRVATAEPTPEQIEVAEAALAACLELERA